MIKAVVSDFGGVVTLPLTVAFKRAHEDLGISLEALGKAMALVAERSPEPPLWTLERGQMSEPDFIAGPSAGLGEVLGRPVALDGYGARLMDSLLVNLAPARAAGMHAIHFRETSQVVAELDGLVA